MKKVFSFLLVISIVITPMMTVAAQSKSRTAKRPINPISTELKFGNVSAFSEDHGVFVKWQMDVEANILGYNVYRVNGEGQALASENMVLGSRSRVGTDTAFGEEYTFFDPNGNVGDVYFVESVNAAGERALSDKAGAGYTSDLSAVAGRSAAALADTSNNRKPELASSRLVLPKLLQTEMSQSTIPPDQANQRLIASKPGVKLGVRTDGFYRVTREQLQTAGFDVGTDPGRWQLYCDGVEQGIVVGPNGNYIEFLGKAKETIESDTRYYFLTLGDNWGKRMPTSVSRPTGVPIPSTNYKQTSFVKERIYYIYDILNGDADNFWGGLVTSNGKNYPFTLTGVDPNGGTADITVKFQGYSLTPHNITVTINGNPVGTTSYSNTDPNTMTATVPVSSLVEGVNTLRMVSGVNTDYSLFDSVSVTFQRKFQAAQDQVRFYTTSYRSTKISGFTSPNVRLFDVTDDGQPAEVINLNVTQNGGTYDINLPAHRGRAMYAIENSAAKPVATIEANVPSTLSTPNHNAQLVIITYPDFSRAASRWAQYRTSQGISAEVVDVRDIYDEFDYGQSSSASITAFVEYAYANWQTPPQYILLLGDSTYDPKNYEGHGYQNYVPTKIVNTVYTETGSDEAMVDFNNDGLAEIAVGRIPAATSQEVTNALAKVQAFEIPAMQTLDRGVIFAYDLPNGYDFAGMSNTLKSNLPVATPSVMVDRGAANSQATLISEINNGRYMVNYSGHGTQTSWASTSFFGTPSVPSLTNANNQSIFTMLTCLNGYFINPNADSLAEKLIKAQNGGAVIAWASSGKTTPDVQMVMAIRFYNQIGLGNITRIGDLIKDAKAQIPGGSDVRNSWVLMGDPMLKVR